MSQAAGNELTGSRVYGQTVVKKIEPYPGRPGQFRITATYYVDTRAGGEQLHHRVRGRTVMLQCILAAPEETALKLSVDSLLNLTGEIERFERIPETAKRVGIVRLYLRKVRN